ncbi:cobalt-precorrin-6A reductase [Bacillus sp. FJAT-47783]|uniref:cobalt-precorrin-6A reductase n=1 Tax=Bacillus sp. FJAT-47783 TaxID=2922712 RepID=UPI001FAD3374|nr:cobalt-precorrin-6A reductase [Bacillus sp. FJAT-47783]
MILLLAGTSDAKKLALLLKDEGYDLITSVVTENAANELKEVQLPVRVGRMNEQMFEEFVTTKHVELIVDASHPFAEEVSKTAMKIANRTNIPYVRYERESQTFHTPYVTYVNDYEEAANVAAERKGVILLTTGSKTLHIFAERLLDQPNTRLIARMLPRKDNMEKCEALGIPQKNIVAIQGPFTKEFNQALLKQYGVTLMISKESGKEGSVDEKLEAAKELKIETIMIKRPKIEYETMFHTFDDIVRHVHMCMKNKAMYS